MEQQWISVKERLPENDDRVLTYDKYGNIWIGYMEPDSPASYGLGWQDEEGYNRPVTHWMPLPKPPKE